MHDMARKTLNFTDDAGTQHAVPASRVMDIRFQKDGKVILLLSGSELYTVTSPTYADMVIQFQGLPDWTMDYTDSSER